MLKKLLNIILVVALITLLFLPVFSKATEINMNLTNNNNSTRMQTEAQTSQNVLDSSELDNASIPESYSSTSSTIGTLSSLPEAELGLTNILSIILIVIGVLLILLAIAILIRLRH